VPGRASGIKMVDMAEVGAPVSLDVVAVHLDCWCICLCYLHFAQENQEAKIGGTPHMPMQTGGGETQPERSTTLCYGAWLC